MAIEVPTPPQRKINTPFAGWCHFPTTGLEITIGQAPDTLSGQM